MENNFHADNEERETPSSAALDKITDRDEDNSSTPDSGDTAGGDDIMVPKHRFDEVNSQLKELKKQFEEQRTSFQSTKEVQDRLARAFAGGAEKGDPEVQNLIKQYNLPETFVDDFAGVLDKRLQGKIEEKLRPLQTSAAEMHFRSEMAELKAKYPAVNDWDNDKVAELRKTYASEERYRGLSLEEIFRLKHPELTTQTGSSYTAETSSGRTAKTSGEKSVAEMSDSEWHDYLRKQGVKEDKLKK